MKMIEGMFVMKKKGGSFKAHRPPAKAVAADKNADDIFGFLAGKGTITGDIVSPVISPKEWGNLYPSPRPRRRRR
jgi:hypothetical protein